MPVQRIAASDFGLLSNPGVTSLQIIWPVNAPDAQVTITRVTMAPGAVSPRHSHPHSEQTWIVERGTATLLLAGDETQTVAAGEVLRTPAGEIHGVANTGSEPFVYLSVTTPPQNFTAAYQRRGSGAHGQIPPPQDGPHAATGAFANPEYDS